MNYSRVAHFMEIGGLTVYQKPTVKFFKRSKNRKLPSQLEDTTQPTP
jgi:hypothetical protein